VQDNLIAEPAAVTHLRSAFAGTDKLAVAGAVPAKYWGDWSTMPHVRPLALVLPRSTEDVAIATRICNRHGQPLAVQGGMTGLAGAATPRSGEIAISLERLTGIIEIDAASATLTALAGTPLQLVQQAAHDAGFHCGIDLGARGSCTIGGNAATNAGGTQVLRYGMARRNILGLEAVLADGTVVSSLNKMLKNNAGYDWTQLLIGSEGTLGIITRVVVQLQPRQRAVASAMLEVPDFDAALKVLRRTEVLRPGALLSFEAMWPDFHQFAVHHFALSAPLPDSGHLWLLVDFETAEGHTGANEFFDLVSQLFEEGLITNAAIAKSMADRDRFWAIRESPAEYSRVLPGLISFDVSLPLGKMSAIVEALRRTLLTRWPTATALFFGHVADSNLHLVMHVPDAPAATKAAVEDTVYGMVAAHGGSVSAEHGIGQLKLRYLGHSRSPTELALMRRIKEALDPRGILTPGRVLCSS